MQKLVTVVDGKNMEFSADEVIRKFQLRGLRRLDGTEIPITESFQTRKECRLISDSKEIEVPVGAHITVDENFQLGFIMDEDMQALYARDVPRKLESKEIRI